MLARMSTNPIDSLPPLPPQEMSSILGDSSAVQAMGGVAATEPLPGTGAFLDLSTAALELTPSEQIEMAELEDDAALFGGAVGSSSFAAPQPAATPVEPSYDPTADVANPAYLDQPDAFDWSKDLANPAFWA
jgi:hypothetical protein